METEFDVISPAEDIDVAHDVDTLRIERLSGSSIYFAGYTDGDDEPEFRYWANCTEDGLELQRERTDPDDSSEDP